MDRGHYCCCLAVTNVDNTTNLFQRPAQIQELTTFRNRRNGRGSKSEKHINNKSPKACPNTSGLQRRVQHSCYMHDTRTSVPRVQSSPARAVVLLPPLRSVVKQAHSCSSPLVDATNKTGEGRSQRCLSAHAASFSVVNGRCTSTVLAWLAEGCPSYVRGRAMPPVLIASRCGQTAQGMG